MGRVRLRLAGGSRQAFVHGDWMVDRFTRSYLIGLVTVVAAVIALWAISSWDPGASRLNKRLAGKDPKHPDMVAAQARLAHHQQRAQAIVEAQPEISSVRWVLDRDCYAARGVPLP